MPEPLVSICVITYNSSETVIETLESIYNQTYRNIELIVSDDCSSDNTVEIVKNWLDEKRSRFQAAEIITVEKNTGVTGNVNRAVKKAKGKYVKDIAGDDILLNDYTEKCVSYLEKNPETDVLFTDVKFFSTDNSKVHKNSIIDYNFFNKNAEEQFSQIIKNGLPCIPTPSSIYTKKILEKLDYFDENIPMWEDGPIYFKLAKNNIKLYFLDTVGVLNRVRKDSLSNGAPYSHRKSSALYYKLYVYPYDKKNNPIKAQLRRLKYFLLYHSNIPIIYKFLKLTKKI